MESNHFENAKSILGDAVRELVTHHGRIRERLAQAEQKLFRLNDNHEILNSLYIENRQEVINIQKKLANTNMSEDHASELAREIWDIHTVLRSQ